MLIGMFFVPIWQITLEAPQYPEGLGMNIHLHTVEGAMPNDLENINGLNHYIGMKRIVPDSISELQYMRYIMAVIMILGFVAAYQGKRWMLLSWILLFIVIGIVGMVDFYLWEYSYGHDLDPRAIIKIPGMSYQPPLIGSQQILNFMAHSYPGPGAIIAVASIGLAGFAWWTSRHKPRRAETARPADSTGDTPAPEGKETP